MQLVEIENNISLEKLTKTWHLSKSSNIIMEIRNDPELHDEKGNIIVSKAREKLYAEILANEKEALYAWMEWGYEHDEAIDVAIQMIEKAEFSGETMALLGIGRMQKSRLARLFETLPSVPRMFEFDRAPMRIEVVPIFVNMMFEIMIANAEFRNGNGQGVCNTIKELKKMLTDN